MKVLQLIRVALRVAVGVVAALEIVLGLGVLLRLLAANADASFVDWTFRNQDRLMTPFEGMFDPVELSDTDGIVDLSGLFAMAVYGCAFIPLVVGLGRVDARRRRIEDRQRREVDAVRQARIFGDEPSPEPAPEPSLAAKVQMVLRRNREKARDQETDTDRPEPDNP